jgi:hypothetical protein
VAAPAAKGSDGKVQYDELGIPKRKSKSRKK